MFISCELSLCTHFAYLNSESKGGVTGRGGREEKEGGGREGEYSVQKSVALAHGFWQMMLACAPPSDSFFPICYPCEKTESVLASLLAPVNW